MGFVYIIKLTGPIFVTFKLPYSYGIKATEDVDTYQANSFRANFLYLFHDLLSQTLEGSKYGY